MDATAKKQLSKFLTDLEMVRGRQAQLGGGDRAVRAGVEILCFVLVYGKWRLSVVASGGGGGGTHGRCSVYVWHAGPATQLACRHMLLLEGYCAAHRWLVCSHMSGCHGLCFHWYWCVCGW